MSIIKTETVLPEPVLREEAAGQAGLCPGDIIAAGDNAGITDTICQGQLTLDTAPAGQIRRF